MSQTESTLSLAYVDLMEAVAAYLGYATPASPYDGTGSSPSTDPECDGYVQAGYRQFLYPPPVDKGESRYPWRFLKPTTTLYAWATVDVEEDDGLTAENDTPESGQSTLTAQTATFYPSMVGSSITIDSTDYEILTYTSSTVIVVDGNPSAAEATAFTITSAGNYRLPGDCGSIQGPLTLYDPDGTCYRPITFTSEQRIRQNRMQDYDLTGFPSWAAVRPLSTAGTTGQRFELMVWPTPDQTYQLEYRYIILPPKLDATNKYPLGGLAHGETIKASCLSVAERERNDPKLRDWQKRFLELLAQSIAVDRAANAAEHYGFMRGSEQLEYRSPAARHGYAGTFTINGVPLEDY